MSTLSSISNCLSLTFNFFCPVGLIRPLIGNFLQTAKDTSCDVEILVKDSQDKWKTVLNHSGQVKNSLAKGHFCRINFKKPLALKVKFNIQQIKS